MNQFQHFRLEFVWLEHQLRRLSQDMIDSNSYCHLNVMQWKLEGMLRRMESVHMAQRNIASVSLQLQQHQQGINSKYNLILQQHLTRVIINMAGVPQPQQEQQGSGRNEFDNNFVHEFVQNELSMTELSQSNSGESTHDWVMVGMNFARHSYLRKLKLCLHVLGCNREADTRGIANNESLRALQMICRDDMWGNSFQNLTPLLGNVSRISLKFPWSITDDEIRFFSCIVAQGGRNLQDIDFSCIHMSDKVAAELICSLDKLVELKALDLRDNNIAMQGCKSLAVLLRNPESKLETLKLGSNKIGDAEAEVLAASLSGNKCLEALLLTNLHGQHSNRNLITTVGWAAFTKVLRVSNHTLQSVTDTEKSSCQACQLVCDELELIYFLKMNSNKDKKALAYQKINTIQDTFSIEFEQYKKKKMLPSLLSCIARAAGVGSELYPLFAVMKFNLPLWTGE